MDQSMSAPAVAMVIVLAICFVALVMLVVSLPGIKGLLRRLPQTPRRAHGPSAHPHPPGLRP